MAETLEQAVGWAVQTDQDLRVEVRRLAWLLLDQAYEIMESGRPQDRISLISRLVPPMLRALGEEDQSGRGIDELRKDLRTVLKEVRTGIESEPGGTGEPTDTPGEATVDSGQELQRRPIRAELGPD